jgi:homoserine dehydrogenase
MEVADRPGVLHAITGELGKRMVSVRSMRQRGLGDDARLIFVTHKAREADLRDAVDAARRLESVHRVGSVLRVMGEEE